MNLKSRDKYTKLKVKIASYLKLEVVGMTEKGVLALAGMGLAGFFTWLIVTRIFDLLTIVVSK